MQKNGLRQLFWHLFHYQLSKTEYKKTWKIFFLSFLAFVLWVYAVQFPTTFQGREVLKPVFGVTVKPFSLKWVLQISSLEGTIYHLKLQEILKNSSGEDFKKANNLKNHKRT